MAACFKGTPMNEKTKLERMEFAIANYNAMIRSLKKQMQAGTVGAGAIRRTIARYQQGRHDPDAQLGLERIT
jgi:hypothetical protein